MEIDPAPVAVTDFEATPPDETTVAGSPLTVPVPLTFANVTAWEGERGPTVIDLDAGPMPPRRVTPVRVPPAESPR